MNTRKCFAVFLSLILLSTLLVSCKADGSIGKDSQEKILKVCFDSQLGTDDIEHDMYDFLYSFKQVTGIENIEIEYLPYSGAERETAISRIRVELMSGVGPDVFIASCGRADHSLFPYPEKVIETGMFLPLDAYITDHTEFTEWEKQQPTVLAAGRNKEGQQIIPLVYECPIQIYPKEDVNVDPQDRLFTFEDALGDSETSSIYAEFYNCEVKRFAGPDEISVGFAPSYLEYFLGPLADFDAEKLLFTENELLSMIKCILDLSGDSFVDGTKYHEIRLSKQMCRYSQPFTMIPIYSRKGGITVSITSFAAINRNTTMPNEAYKFIDFFMRKNTQADSHIYQNLYMFEGLPLHEDLFSESLPYNHFDYLSNESFDELKEIKAQISSVSFRSELSSVLSTLMSSCWLARENGQPIEELVHEAYTNMQRRVGE